MNNQEETWKDIPNYEGYYQVSNLGRVKSLKRKGVLKEKILKQWIDSVGYYQIGLTFNAKTKFIRIHQILAITFLNHKPNGHKIVVDHIDGNKLNNNLDNLQLITHRGNVIKGNVSNGSLGVSFYNKKYYARYWKDKINIYLGRYDTEIEAASAYKKFKENEESKT